MSPQGEAGTDEAVVASTISHGQGVFAHKACAQCGSEMARSMQVLTSLKDRASVMAHAMARDLEQVGDKDDIGKRLERFLSRVAAGGERLRLTHVHNPAGILNTASVGQVLLEAGSAQLLTVSGLVCAQRALITQVDAAARDAACGRKGAASLAEAERTLTSTINCAVTDWLTAARNASLQTPLRQRDANRRAPAVLEARKPRDDGGNRGALGARDLRPAMQQPADFQTRDGTLVKVCRSFADDKPCMRKSCSFALCNRKLSRADEQELKQMFRRYSRARRRGAPRPGPQAEQ